jgi:hypothetical protein
LLTPLHNNECKRTLAEVEVPMTATPISSASHQEALPVGRHAPLWSRHGLVVRMVQGRRELRTIQELIRAIVPEPILAWLEAADHRVIRRVRVRGRVLSKGVITAPDMSALRAPAKMKPPAT